MRKSELDLVTGKNSSEPVMYTSYVCLGDKLFHQWSCNQRMFYQHPYLACVRSNVRLQLLRPLNRRI